MTFFNLFFLLANFVITLGDVIVISMIFQLLALSGSQIGRSLLSQQTDLLADLLALLHTGSERVQRQVSLPRVLTGCTSALLCRFVLFFAKRSHKYVTDLHPSHYFCQLNRC